MKKFYKNELALKIPRNLSFSLDKSEIPIIEFENIKQETNIHDNSFICLNKTYDQTKEGYSTDLSNTISITNESNMKIRLYENNGGNPIVNRMMSPVRARKDSSFIHLLDKSDNSPELNSPELNSPELNLTKVNSSPRLSDEENSKII